jgi:hypothetical protein
MGPAIAIKTGASGGDRTHHRLFTLALQVTHRATNPSKDAAFIAFSFKLQKEHLEHKSQRVSTKASTKLVNAGLTLGRAFVFCLECQRQPATRTDSTLFLWLLLPIKGLWTARMVIASFSPDRSIVATQAQCRFVAGAEGREVYRTSKEARGYRIGQC